MALTMTSSVFTNMQPKGPHVGVVTVRGTMNFPDATTTKPSVGDIAFLCKVPHGAVITDIRVEHTCADTIGLDYGVATGTTIGGSASYSAFVSALAKGTISRMSALNTSAGFTISVSDADPNRYGIVSAKIASVSAATATVTIYFTVEYSYDRNTN